MAELEQVTTLDLPTLIVSSARETTIQTAGYLPPGFGVMGAWTVGGELKLGVRVKQKENDPTKVTLTFRVLSVQYEPPADCPDDVLDAIRDVNARFLSSLRGQSSDNPPG